MDETTYNRVMNGCCIIAVGSALLFEQSGEWQGIVVAGGILAGLVASFVYLYDQWHHEEGVSSAEEADTSDLSSPQDAGERLVLFSSDEDKIREVRRIKIAMRYAKLRYAELPVSSYVSEHSTSQARAGEIIARIVRENPIVSREPDPWRRAVDEVVKMTDRLPRHKFEITPDGRVTMRSLGKQRRVDADELAQAKEKEAYWPEYSSSRTIH